MHKLIIRKAIEVDYPIIVKLNEEAVEHTSVMDLNRLQHLASLAFYFPVAELKGKVIAFLLAMQAGAAYRNDNFEWFSNRYDKFIYVDRIVVDQAFHGRGIGTRLYEDLFAYARQRDTSLIACEINSIPPNEISARFHSRLGFKEVGAQWVFEGKKKVSMQVAQTVK